MIDEYVVVRVRSTDPANAVIPSVAGRKGLGRPRSSERRSASTEPKSRPTQSLGVDVITDAAALARTEDDPDVRAKAPSMPMKLIAPVSIRALSARPSESRSKVSWGVRAVGADTSRLDGRGVVVAVLDTGIDRNHPAFEGVELIERDFTGAGNGDTNGHGTHCAATIFGRDVERKRIGIARGVSKALIAKVIGNNCSSASIASAIHWAVENKANVISMSLGIDFPKYQAALQKKGYLAQVATSLALEGYRKNLSMFDSISELVRSLESFHQPCILVAAAGNESGRNATPPFEIAASPPAVAKGFVCVAALQQGRQGFTVASFSNTGASVSGPGVDILSAQAGGGLVSMDGTSMAAPHVAGVAALYAQKLKQEDRFTSDQLSAVLLASATKAPLHASSTYSLVGAGIVRAAQE